MTELKSIWHKPSEKPTEHKTIFAQHKSLRDNTIECFMWEIQEFTDAIRKDVITWCYLDDLLACEKELTDTKKKLDIAVDGITYMRNNCLDYAADYMDYADKILEQINQREEQFAIEPERKPAVNPFTSDQIIRTMPAKGVAPLPIADEQINQKE